MIHKQPPRVPGTEKPRGWLFLLLRKCCTLLVAPGILLTSVAMLDAPWGTQCSLPTVPAEPHVLV